MTIFKEYDFNELLNKNNFEKLAIDYLKENPCCNENNCTHPPFQSDNELWKNKNFYPISEKIASIIFDQCNKKFNLNIRMWVYFQKKGTTLKSLEWHNHYRGETKEEFSFILYLSDTPLGTLFQVNNKIIKLKPRKNILYAWESKYEHAPELGKHNKNRVVIAGDCLLD